ncbi:MAG: hypothetical protein GY765_23205 [bacterium]|nr:hypothetical protein [bacterium]
MDISTKNQVISSGTGVHVDPEVMVTGVPAESSGPAKQAEVQPAGEEPVTTPEPADTSGTTGTNGTPDGQENPDGGKRTKSQSYATQRQDIYSVLKVALEDDDYVTRMAGHKYTPEKVEEGNQLYQGVVDLKDTAGNYGAIKKLKNLELTNSQEATEKAFGKTLSFCRTLFEDEPTFFEQVEIGNRSARTFDDWLERRRKFYKRVMKMPEALEIMAQNGISLERLQAEQQMVAATADIDVERENLAAEAQQAVQDYKKAFKLLKRWIRDYRDVAKVEFRDEPRQLKKVGIFLTVKS